ncbi:hypothetical protein RhiJN_03578 [Ceratobasidium sp. AG-Ba]|nr:hypothetical protein RhiJN_03578 [Ceratobasidium sp. AG-Ba]QRW04477.1 hypothetical protein RhiLY_03476 [Ceratobasidium sp. AG-Ba]
MSCRNSGVFRLRSSSVSSSPFSTQCASIGSYKRGDGTRQNSGTTSLGQTLLSKDVSIHNSLREAALSIPEDGSVSCLNEPGSIASVPWKKYWDLVRTYRVEVFNWPMNTDGSMKDPSHLGGGYRLYTSYLEDIKTGKRGFRWITDEVWEERMKEHNELVSAGVIDPCKQRSDKGKSKKRQVEPENLADSSRKRLCVVADRAEEPPFAPNTASSESHRLAPLEQEQLSHSPVAQTSLPLSISPLGMPAANCALPQSTLSTLNLSHTQAFDEGLSTIIGSSQTHSALEHAGALEYTSTELAPTMPMQTVFSPAFPPVPPTLLPHLSNPGWISHDDFPFPGIPVENQSYQSAHPFIAETATKVSTRYRLQPYVASSTPSSPSGISRATPEPRTPRARQPGVFLNDTPESMRAKSQTPRRTRRTKQLSNSASASVTGS